MVTIIGVKTSSFVCRIHRESVLGCKTGNTKSKRNHFTYENGINKKWLQEIATIKVEPRKI